MVIKRQNYEADCVMAGEYLFALREFALIRGICAKTLLEGTNLDMHILLNPPRHILATEISQVGANLVNALGDQLSSAVEFGNSMFVGIHGPLGVAIQGANTLFEAANLFQKYMITRSGINDINIQFDNDLIRISVKELPLEGKSRQIHVQNFYNLASLISILNITKQLLRNQKLRGDIIFNLPYKPSPTFVLSNTDGISVNFDQDECELVLPSSWAALPISQLDKELVDTAMSQCDDDLARFSSKDLGSEIAYLLEISKGSCPTIEEISAHFHMSPSSLQRQLREKDLTYTKIRTQVLCKKASKLLAETNYSIGDIATYVGFSDASNFSKAFKAWQGDSPGTYREKIASKT